MGNDSRPIRAIPTLKRGLNLPLITLYGLGTVIGAGIYVLVGQVVSTAGIWAPISFMLAAGLACFSALSFAELCARLPRSAGEAAYVFAGFGSRALSVLVGILVILIGSVSCATLSTGFAAHVREVVDVSPALLVVIVVFTLGTIAAWGITESVVIATLATLFEIGGLVAVILGALPVVLDGPAVAITAPSLFSISVWTGVLSGTVLAFFAFIGFEDMVNVAEEVKDATRTLPRGIILTLIVSTVLYAGISLVAVLSVPIDAIASSGAPLATIFATTTGMSPLPITAIGIVAVLNGGLIQIIMGSRVLYGLADQGHLPAVLARVHSRTRTPLVATGAITGFVLALALLFPLVTLAKAASLIALIVFTLVNGALIRIKRHDPTPNDVLTFPTWIPWLGLLTCATFAAFQIVEFL